MLAFRMWSSIVYFFMGMIWGENDSGERRYVISGTECAGGEGKQCPGGSVALRTAGGKVELLHQIQQPEVYWKT